MSAPVMTKAAAGVIVSAASVALSATNTTAIYATASGAGTANLATDTVFETQLQIDVLTLGAVAATWGVQVSCFRGGTSAGSGATPPVWDTQGGPTVVVGGTGTGAATTHYRQTVYLPTAPGWQIQCKNLDATNGITLTINADTVSAVA